MKASTRPRRFLFEYTQAAVIALIFALFARTFLVQAFRIPTPSMEDTVLVGDHILVNKFVTAPLAYPLERALLPMSEVRRGDIAIFRYPHDPTQDYVKRVIGIPGDSIHIIKGAVYVREPGQDGYVAQLEPYARHKVLGNTPDMLDNFGPIEVPEGQYFVMGDNRDDSLDSREWGFVPRDLIVGRALLVYWSFEGLQADGSIAAAPRDPDAGRVQSFLDNATAFFRGTRWSRFGQPLR